MKSRGKRIGGIVEAIAAGVALTMLAGLGIIIMIGLAHVILVPNNHPTAVAEAALAADEDELNRVLTQGLQAPHQGKAAAITGSCRPGRGNRTHIYRDLVATTQDEMIQACLAETQRGDSIIALNYIVKMDKDVEFHPDVGDDWSWSAYAREARRAASHTFSFKRKDVILTYLDVNSVTITSAPSVTPLSEVPPSSITTGARAEMPTGPPNLVTFQPKD